MLDVTIRRCVLRVVRRGGIGWGEGGRRFMDDATRALPALIAAELERLLPEGAEGEVTRPLRVDVRVGLPVLREWAARAAREAASGVPTHDEDSAPGQQELRLALRRAFEATGVAAGFAVATQAHAALESADEVAASLTAEHPRATAVLDVRVARVSAIANLLVAWRVAGALQTMLSALPAAVVEAWHRVLFGLAPDVMSERPDAPSNGSSADADYEEIAHTLAVLVSAAKTAGATELVRLRLSAAAELAVTVGLAATAPRARRAIDEHLPVPLSAPVRAAQPAAPSRLRSGTRRAEPGREVRVCSALPFLLLGPLERIGWLDTADATFTAAGLEHTLPALAVALASKVLAVPERGWRRAPQALSAAATFAGDAEPRPDPEVSALTRAVAPLVPALDVVVRRALIDGRSAADPVLLVSDGADRAARMLVDPDGVFFLAQARAPEAWAGFALETKSQIYVPAEEGDANWLSQLDAQGVCFVTPARPTRAETWQLMPGSRAPRLYTNRPPNTPASSFARAEATAQRARQAWQAFACRPLPGGADDDPSLDVSLTLAAALALGTIAWTLWRTREPTCPALALERFFDLEATVRFEASAVRVRLALGKRYRDLHAAGLLHDVPRVPWLGGRPVTFSGG
jgi:hypothetical protein